MFGEDLGAPEQVRLDGLAQVIVAVVAGYRAHTGQIDSGGDRPDHDAGQPPFADQPDQADLAGDGLVVGPELLFVRAEGGGGDADDLGGSEMAQDLLRHAAEGVAVGFIDDDELEVIARPAIEPAAERLGAAHHQAITGLGVGVGHLHLRDQAGPRAELVGGLADQLRSRRR